MTPSPTMLRELADRCEAAAGLDRELLNEVAEELGYCLHKKTTWSGYQDDTGFTCDKCGADSWGNLSKNGLRQRLHGGLPAFLTSLDAAITLASDTGRAVHILLGKAMDRMVWARFGWPEMSPDDYRQTLARFFTAACLRALSEERGDG